ncbi:MAG: nitroreductase family protein [Gemmatimonadota bacterium]
MEAGHAVENVCLQAVALGLGATVVGAFHDDEVRRLLRAPELERPLCLVPVGVPAAS